MPTPTSRRRLRWIVLPTLLVLLQLWGGTISWAQQAVRVVAAGATDGQARLVVDARDTAASALPPQSFSVPADGQSQPARAGPLLSDRLTAALRSRHLLTLPVPGNPPRPALVRVATPNGALTADSVISAQAQAGTGALPVIIAALVLAAVALLAGGDLIARNRRRAPPEPPPHEQPEAPCYEPRPAATASPDPLEHRAWNVPARGEPVIDRKPLLAAIGRTLRAGRPVVLAPGEGHAGVGVTTAMIEFAHRNRDDYDIVWWIAAQHPQLVGEQMAQLAEAIGLAAPTDTAGQATAGLLDALGRRGRWLLVFDDAESPYQLARFFPAGSGHVLVASTDPTARGEQAAPLVVPPFTRNQSVQLLRARHTALRPNEAGRVAAPLEDLPLTVDTAAATLAESGMGVHAYLRLICEHPASAVWSVAFERLAADDPPALALLTLLAWLGPEPFPLSQLTRHPDLLPAALAESAQARPQLAERAATLQRRGLARVDGEIVQVHRVPAAQLIQAHRRGSRGRRGMGGARGAPTARRGACRPGRPGRVAAVASAAAAHPGRHGSGPPPRRRPRRGGVATRPRRRLPPGPRRTEARPRPGHRLLRPLPPPTRPRPPRYPDIRPHPDRRPARPRPTRPGPPPARGSPDRCRHAPTANTR